MMDISSIWGLKLYGSVTVGNALIGLLILIVSIIVAKIVVLYTRRTLKERLDKEHLELLTKVVYYSIVIIGTIMMLNKFGMSVGSLLVAGGFLGIAIGFASKSVVGNLVSGLFLLFERPMKIGDSVNVGDVSGVVTDISILSTKIRTWDGLYVRVPNEKVFTSNITNYVAHPVRRFEYKVGIRYRDDAEKAVNTIKNVIESHPFALKNPSPQIFVENLGNSAVEIIVRIWSPSSVWYSVKTELLWKIKKELENNGIEIPFPQQVVWFGNELKMKKSRK